MNSNKIKTFLDFVDECQNTHDLAFENMKKEDARLQDLLHAIEFETKAKERSKMCTRLHKSRIERREYKNVVELTEDIVNFFQEPQHKKTLARIDKMRIIHKSRIPRRWFEGESLLVPTPNEILTVYNRAIEYLELSVRRSLEEYNKFYKNYENVSHLSFEDVKRILWSILGKNNLEVTYDKTKNILITKVDKNQQGILTLVNWYDSIESTEEHK